MSRTHPVVVIGTGAAGMAAAVHLAEAGVPVALVTKNVLGDGSTAWAQGGLAAVTAEGIAAGDSLALHVQDSLTAGAGLCDDEVVRELVHAAPASIDRLRRLGAVFDTTAGGDLALGLEGGHHARRIVHAGGDASGAEVARTLAVAVRAAAETGRLEVVEHAWAVDLLSVDGTVGGVRLMTSDGATTDRRAAAVVLASGGIGQLWTTTTNPPSSTGDGLALAARAGARLRDVEFMQFHPTILVVDPAHRRPGDRGVLISEAVRGEGAVIVDGAGHRVMEGVHPLADLAPRDVVSATMQAYLSEHDLDHLYLDGTALGADVWDHHFPTIAQMCRERGVDPATTPIPIRPAAHYFCGGVQADLSGRTSVPGLYAIGEVACTGVQGANRLASNSLTEALVAGDRCGALLTRTRPSAPHGPLTAPDTAWVAADQAAALRVAATRDAGVVRDEAGLARFAALLEDVPTRAAAPSPADVEATSLHLAASLLTAAARERTESRGCHRRSDHPEPDPTWQRHLTWVWDEAPQLVEDRSVAA